MYSASGKAECPQSQSAMPKVEACEPNLVPPLGCSTMLSYSCALYDVNADVLTNLTFLRLSLLASVNGYLGVKIHSDLK